MKKQKRLEKKAQRLKELEAAVEASGRINLQQYSSAHLRLFGPTVVDYWPGSGKCWVTGSNEKSIVMEPHEVVNVCLAEPLPPGAREHLESIGDTCEARVPTTRAPTPKSLEARMESQNARSAPGEPGLDATEQSWVHGKQDSCA